jgi:hypothetical protein
MKRIDRRRRGGFEDQDEIRHRGDRHGHDAAKEEINSGDVDPRGRPSEGFPGRADPQGGPLRFDDGLAVYTN